MQLLTYAGLDASRLKSGYDKCLQALRRGDFRSADVKKLSASRQLPLYRAKLNDADRLIFTIVRHGDTSAILLLEAIVGHAYDKSRFLRGAAIDEGKIPQASLEEARADARPLRYLHPERTILHLLDKPVSFDDAQEEVYLQPPPIIIVGSAGSGKTALLLEKLKEVEGEVLYLTLSGYLAENARNLYYANGFEHGRQEADFLSYRDFLESIRVPSGREATWNHFAGWFPRVSNTHKGIAAHQAFEEIRGVITAGAAGPLTLEAYEALGIRQSIFSGPARQSLYGLYGKYLAWLKAEGLYDMNLVAHQTAPLARPRYDFIAVDEVQDLTPAQLTLVLQTLRHPDRFMLSGDSNQIVHPNFFSWSQLKTLFWKDPALGERQQVSILRANFRNGTDTTRLANRLLIIKQRRFGSIDRESNYLVDAIGEDRGSVTLIADRAEEKRELNLKTKQSARFALIVMRDEDKAEARRHFSTPLLFSIHEAKGLEYENIVLYNIVSSSRREFAEVANGVGLEDLLVEELQYSRAKDKGDKSLEAYKFFVNALYVAMTRAVRNLYLVESDTAHPLFSLLELLPAGKVAIKEERSTHEEWQKEAHKLERQGKVEQAGAIRSSILQETPPPWPVFDEGRIRELLVKVFSEGKPGGKPRQQLYEYATCHDEPVLARRLVSDGGYRLAENFEEEKSQLGRKSYLPYFSKHFKGIGQQCKQHGVDHRLPMNQTPLMAASAAGNIELVELLLDSGADTGATDHYGQNALHWAMKRALCDQEFARGAFGGLYPLIAPPAIDLQVGGRLVRLSLHHAEYLLFQTFWVLFRGRFSERQYRRHAAFCAQDILDAWEHLPAVAVLAERKRRQYLSALLSRNERDRDYAYNRALFRRVAHGWYQPNPLISVRRTTGEQDRWEGIAMALNLPLIHEFADETLTAAALRYGVEAGIPVPGPSICSAGFRARLAAMPEPSRLARDPDSSAILRAYLHQKEAAMRADKLRQEQLMRACFGDPQADVGNDPPAPDHGSGRKKGGKSANPPGPGRPGKPDDPGRKGGGEQLSFGL